MGGSHRHGRASFTASQCQNTDLYWALSGGAGGTYEVVLSVTSKVYPNLQTSATNFTFTNEGVTLDTFYDVVQLSRPGYRSFQLALDDEYTPPSARRLTPGGGAYIDEADFQ